jgi:peptidoglycan/xylan/chitin deacetylase (PgdA/CDA1 family)
LITDRPVVLVYHGIGAGDDAWDAQRLLTSPDHLAAHVRLLKGRKYRFVVASELASDEPPPRRTAALTFDDGWRNWLSTALPVLRSLGVRGTFFVCPGLFGGTHPDLDGEAGALLDEAGVRELHDAGMEIGSHTLGHPDLRGLDDAELERELRDSKRAIEAITGEPCRVLAYPYGLYDDRVVRAAREAGYEVAFGWLSGPWRRFEAPRLPAPPRHGARRLSLKLLGVRRPGR